MDKIIANLQDPSWWFTSVVIAIGASILAAYAKDFIEFFLSRFSTRAKRAFDRRRRQREEKLKILVNNPNILVIEYIRAAIYIIVFSFSSACLFLVSIWYKISYDFRLSVNEGDVNLVFETRDAEAITIMLIAGLVSSILGYMSVSFIRFLGKAHSQYLEMISQSPQNR